MFYNACMDGNIRLLKWMKVNCEMEGCLEKVSRWTLQFGSPEVRELLLQMLRERNNQHEVGS